MGTIMIKFVKPRRPVDRVFLHCSASDHAHHDSAATMDGWHKENGWSGIGYHFFGRKSGLVEIGRDIELIPAAQGGHNQRTIAICLHGLRKDRFTEAQFSSLRSLCGDINSAYRGKVTFHGHKEVAAKACPVFDYRAVLGLDKYGRMQSDGFTPDIVKNDLDELPLLRIGNVGVAVELLQQLLNIKDDGIFGTGTRAAVKRFQRDNGLKRDGVVGSKTWAALR